MPVERKSFTGTEIRAGMMVFISGVVLLAFMAAILKFRPERGENVFYVPMTDIAGLDRSADVRFGGMIVGRVSQITSDPKNHSQMIITAKISKQTPINTDSRAYVGQISLTSEKHLEITTGTREAALLKSGASIGTIPPVGPFGDLSGLMASVQGLIADVQVLLGVSDGRGNRILEAEKTKTIADIFGQLDGVMGDLRLTLGVVDDKGQTIPPEERKSLNQIMASLDGTLTDGRKLVDNVNGVLDENREQIKDLLGSAKEVASSANRLVDNMDTLVNDNRDNIDSLLGSTKEAVGKVNDMMADVKSLVVTLQGLLERNGPQFDDLVETLKATMRNLEELTRTLADQPQAIIRGKEPVGRQ
jgi:phospholipid/cholesterol/gamma-HCH transport system substrate-binding protein